MAEDDAPIWNDAKAKALIGATAVVGVTHLEADGETVVSKEQYFGVIESAVEGVGITLRLGGTHDGEAMTLPPDLSAFEEAAPGVYRLRRSGDEVENPNFTCVWTITRPPQ